MNSYWNPLAERRDVVPDANKCIDRNCLDGIAHDMAVQPAYIVIHTEVGTEAAAQTRFENPNDAGHASAHYSVNLDGSIVQFVDEKDAAYHAGDFSINMDSIGIEHEDNGDYNGPRTPQLYASSARLVRDISDRYGIPLDRAHVRRHNEVSDAPTGCPDGLDIDHILAKAVAGDFTAGPAEPEVHLGPYLRPVSGVVLDGTAFDWITLAPAGTIPAGVPVTYSEAKRVGGEWYIHVDGGTWAIKDAGFDTFNAHDPANDPQKVWDDQHAAAAPPAPPPGPAPAPPPDPSPPKPVPTPSPAPAPVPEPPKPPVEVNVPPLPDPGPPDEPAPVAEAGVTTSEWLALVRYSQQLAAAGTVAVLSYVGLKLGVHFNVPPEALSAIVDLELAGGIAVVGYAISRGIRKFGTGGGK